jgi:hypothetical protein
LQQTINGPFIVAGQKREIPQHYELREWFLQHNMNMRLPSGQSLPLSRSRGHTPDQFSSGARSIVDCRHDLIISRNEILFLAEILTLSLDHQYMKHLQFVMCWYWSYWWVVVARSELSGMESASRPLKRQTVEAIKYAHA